MSLTTYRAVFENGFEALTFRVTIYLILNLFYFVSIIFYSIITFKFACLHSYVYVDQYLEKKIISSMIKHSLNIRVSGRELESKSEICMQYYNFINIILSIHIFWII